jgi:hypothetical protein
MANKEHLAILKQGVEVWNKWREANPSIVPDLIDSQFGLSDLSGVDLSEVYLNGANFYEVNLCGAILKGADLREACFCRVVFNKTDLSKAIIGYTIFIDVDLREINGLDLLDHFLPSNIDINTFYRSKGKISKVFLRNAGVPNNFIEYIYSLTGDAFQFYSCFISYSSKDQGFAQRLHADLQAKGVRCWFAPHDVKGGKKLHEQIDQAIRIYDKLLLILSDDSMNSEWVKTEIANARQRELKEKRQMLFPVSLVSFERIREWKAFDADTGKDSAREIREYYIPDFSNWKDHDSYQKAFDRLMRDLKA